MEGGGDHGDDGGGGEDESHDGKRQEGFLYFSKALFSLGGSWEFRERNKRRIKKYCQLRKTDGNSLEDRSGQEREGGVVMEGSRRRRRKRRRKRKGQEEERTKKRQGKR